MNDGPRKYRASERVLSVEPSFDISAIVEGQRFAEEIARKRSPQSELEYDTRPSIGNATVAVTLKTEAALRDYIKTRQPKSEL